MDKKINLLKFVLLFKKNLFFIIFVGVIGIGLFALSLVLFVVDFNQGTLLIISLALISFSFIKCSIYASNRYDSSKQLQQEFSDLSREKKKGRILLKAGRLCSWQYSMKAGILKLETMDCRLLGAVKSYYTSEELKRNRHLKRILNVVASSQDTVFDEEAYFPFIHKWVIIRGQCIDYSIEETPNQFIGIILDNTERHETLNRIQEISITDELTGLKNRRYFFDCLNRELSLYSRNKGLFSLAMIDLDYFKKVNDTFGHLAGDYILKELASLIQMEVRPYDIVARFGGEEFIILFPNIGKSDANRIISRLKKRVQASAYLFNEHRISFTFSCGIGDITEMALYTEKEFISIIDSRLYEAKELGRNLVVSGG